MGWKAQAGAAAKGPGVTPSLCPAHPRGFRGCSQLQREPMGLHSTQLLQGGPSCLQTFKLPVTPAVTTAHMGAGNETPLTGGPMRGGVCYKETLLHELSCSHFVRQKWRGPTLQALTCLGARLEPHRAQRKPHLACLPEASHCSRFRNGNQGRFPTSSSSCSPTSRGLLLTPNQPWRQAGLSGTVLRFRFRGRIWIQFFIRDQTSAYTWNMKDS